jgi:hypothetical protein
MGLVDWLSLEQVLFSNQFIRTGFFYEPANLNWVILTKKPLTSYVFKIFLKYSSRLFTKFLIEFLTKHEQLNFLEYGYG